MNSKVCHYLNEIVDKSGRVEFGLVCKVLILLADWSLAWYLIGIGFRSVNPDCFSFILTSCSADGEVTETGLFGTALFFVN